MTLNASGPISLAGATAGQSIAVELGLGATTAISLNDASVRSLAGVASGAIIMPTNFYGKTNFTLAMQGGSGPAYYEVDVEGTDIAFKLVIGSNGSITFFAAGGNDLTINTPDSAINFPIPNVSSYPPPPFTTSFLPTAYGTPTTAGIGSNFEVSYSGTIFVSGSGAILRLFGTNFSVQTGIVTTPFVALSTDQTMTGLATGEPGTPGFVTVGGGTVTIRKIGDPSITTSFNIDQFILSKAGT